MKLPKFMMLILALLAFSQTSAQERVAGCMTVALDEVTFLEVTIPTEERRKKTSEANCSSPGHFVESQSTLIAKIAETSAELYCAKNDTFVASVTPKQYTCSGVPIYLVICSPPMSFDE